jgi:hypothetical protein
MKQIRYCMNCAANTVTDNTHCRNCGSLLPGRGIPLILSDISALRISIKIWRGLAATGDSDKVTAYLDTTDLYCMNYCPCCEMARESEYYPDCSRCPARDFWPAEEGDNYPCERKYGIYGKWNESDDADDRTHYASWIRDILKAALGYHLAMKEMNS